MSMDSVNLSEVAGWCGGQLKGRGDQEVRRVETDSRKVQPGDLFVALIGDRYDAHGFLKDVIERGASAALVQADRMEADGFVGADFSWVEVPDSLTGLQHLASGYRKRLPARVVGVTGSNGKTSTKEFTAAVLRSRMSVWATEGNLNNHIGVPLTLLRGNRDHGAAVIEMGMNHAGEIAPLAGMAAPEVGIITNIGVAHIEHLGSREAIAAEKGALAAAISARGTVVLNAEDEYCGFIAGMTAARVLTAGIGCGEVQAIELRPWESGTRFSLVHEGERAEVTLAVPGRHMVLNATLAAAAGVALDIPLADAARGLCEQVAVRGRLQWRNVCGIRFLDDSYNANPDSMEAAIATLAQTPVSGLRVGVLGRMGELGSFAEEGHRRVGRAAARLGLDWLITVGSEADWIAQEARACGLKRVDGVGDVREAANLIRGQVGEDDVVLVKGSRSAGMERVMEEVERL
jgi:UDP-N-acetylmuramoyl-tripeptide--D-alanyl-D-alanine ligase